VRARCQANPHRPGISPAFGLRAREDAFILSQTDRKKEWNHAPHTHPILEHFSEGRRPVPTRLLEKFSLRLDGSGPVPWSKGPGSVRLHLLDKSGGGDIRRANLDGTGQTTLVSNQPLPAQIALDLAGGLMYWTNWVDRGDIRRANLDGSAEAILVSGLSGPTSIALDLAGGLMYWTDFNGDDIRRANLDGTGQEILITGLPGPRGLALDLANGMMYWVDGPGRDIRRANLDGTGQEILVRGVDTPRYMALDLLGGKLYWTNLGSSDIRRANLDGTGLEILVQNLNSPAGIALDVSRGLMYWIDNGSGDIRRANLDGTGQELLITGLPGPGLIALDLGAPGTALFFAVAAPASGPSGTPFDVTVTARDPYGNIDVNYQGTVTFSTTDPDSGVVLPADYTFTTGVGGDNGVHTFPGGVTLVTVSNQSLTSTDTVNGIIGSATVTVGPGP
jgi:hypothetical protein